MNKLFRKGIYTIDFVLSRIVEIEKILPTGKIEKTYASKKETDMIVDGVNVYANSDRYITFKERGLGCVDCGIVGQYFALETSNPASNRYNFNLYGIDDKGKEILITKDHIKPKSKGGKNHISNYQTMCEHCNSKKGSKY